jgi:hypothetical protein
LALFVVRDGGQKLLAILFGGLPDRLLNLVTGAHQFEQSANIGFFRGVDHRSGICRSLLRGGRLRRSLGGTR